MFQKIIFINPEAATEYTLFKGSLSRSKWICQSVKRLVCGSCSLHKFPPQKWKYQRTWGSRVSPESKPRAVRERQGVELLVPGRAYPDGSQTRSKMHPQGFCSCWMLHNYENHSQLWRTETHPLLQGIILTKSSSKYPCSQPFNLQRWGVYSGNLSCGYYRWI